MAVDDVALRGDEGQVLLVEAVQRRGQLPQRIGIEAGEAGWDCGELRIGDDTKAEKRRALGAGRAGEAAVLGEQDARGGEAGDKGSATGQPR